MNLKHYKTILATSHGKILLLGIVLVIFLSGFILTFYFIDSTFANKISAMVIANIAVGRVPSLSLGYASELSHFWVIATNVYIEMTMVTLLYATFVFRYQNIVQMNYLDSFFKKIKKYKIKYTILFDKYGILGLFVFVFIPFWMTGPIVGAIIGYLIGLRDVTIMITVFIATIIAMIMWGLLLDELITFMNMFNSSVIWFILVLGIVLFLAIKLYRR
ncbi:MAG: small multi-drug export protein [Arcobacteraceae bacterium]|nr:small multi-drug export protein [Arcobacteraceae bacterium]